jgi:chromate transporter
LNEETPLAPVRVSLTQIAAAFARIASTAFGGGSLAMTRRELVRRRGWVTEDGFLELLALAQATPGPNLTNIAVLVGARLRGPAGAFVAFTAMLVPAYLILMLIAAVILSGSGNPWLDAALRGCAAGAVGLTLANAIELTMRYRRDLRALAFVGAAAVAVGLFRLSLPLVLLIFVPLSYAAMQVRRR